MKGFLLISPLCSALHVSGLLCFFFPCSDQIPNKPQLQRKESCSGSQFERIQSATVGKTLWLEQPEGEVTGSNTYQSGNREIGLETEAALA